MADFSSLKSFGLARQLTLQLFGTTHTCFSVVLHIAVSLHFQDLVTLATRMSQKTKVYGRRSLNPHVVLKIKTYHM
jgi:hypothetical protein